jgi:hypothetical protein
VSSQSSDSAEPSRSQPATWMAAGKAAPGVHPPELAFDPKPFLRELEERGIQTQITVTRGSELPAVSYQPPALSHEQEGETCRLGGPADRVVLPGDWGLGTGDRLRLQHSLDFVHVVGDGNRPVQGSEIDPGTADAVAAGPREDGRDWICLEGGMAVPARRVFPPVDRVAGLRRIRVRHTSRRVGAGLGRVETRLDPITPSNGERGNTCTNVQRATVRKAFRMGDICRIRRRQIGGKTGDARPGRLERG